MPGELGDKEHGSKVRHVADDSIRHEQTDSLEER
jgi:hypothetical protein